MRRPAAEASSSATARTVAVSGLPWRSRVPRKSWRTGTPEAPMATSVKPRRQGRPKVSLIMTATRLPVSWRRAAASFFCGKIGVARKKSYNVFAGDVWNGPTPALAQTKPWRVFGDEDMIAPDDAPRLLQDDFDGAGIFLQRRAASARACGEGRMVASRTNRAFGLGDNFFCAMTRRSPFSKEMRALRAASCNLCGQIVAQLNLRQSGQTKQTEITVGDGRFL